MHFAAYFSGEIHFWYPRAKLKQLMYFIYMHVCMYIKKRSGFFLQSKLDCKDLLNSAQMRCVCDVLVDTLCAVMPGINTAVLARQHIMWDGIVVNFLLMQYSIYLSTAYRSLGGRDSVLLKTFQNNSWQCDFIFVRL